MSIMNQYQGSANRHRGRSIQNGVLGISVRSLLNILVALILLGTVWRELSGNENIIEVGGYQITIADPILIALLILVLTTFSKARISKTWLTVSALLFLSFFVLSLIRGLALEPMQALFFGRLYIIIPFAILSASTINIGEFDRRSIFNLIFYSGIILSAIFYYKYITGFGAYDVHSRPLFTWGAFIIIAALSLTMIYQREIGFGRFPRIFIFFFAGALIGSGQGTALAAAALIIVLIFALTSGRLLPTGVRIGIVASGLIVVLLFGSDFVDGFAGQSILSKWVEERAGTSGGRQVVWHTFLGEFSERTLFDRLFGLPMGKADVLFVNLEGNRIWKYSLHNAFLQVLAFSGYSGLIFFSSCIFSIGISCVRLFGLHADRRMTIAAASFAIMMLTYGISYDYRGDAAFHLLLPILLVRAAGASSRQRRGVRGLEA